MASIQKHGGQDRLTYRANNGTIVGLSYEVPVFVLTPEGKAFISDKFWSTTSSKHRNLFIKENTEKKPATIKEEELKKMASVAEGVRK